MLLSITLTGSNHLLSSFNDELSDILIFITGSIYLVTSKVDIELQHHLYLKSVFVEIVVPNPNKQVLLEVD